MIVGLTDLCEFDIVLSALGESLVLRCGLKSCVGGLDIALTGSFTLKINELVGEKKFGAVFGVQSLSGDVGEEGTSYLYFEKDGDSYGYGLTYYGEQENAVIPFAPLPAGTDAEESIEVSFLLYADGAIDLSIGGESVYEGEAGDIAPEGYFGFAQSGNFAEGPGRVFEDYFMDEYSEILVARVRKACGTERPLEGKKVIVDAGNGAGGFFTEKVLKPLGADTAGSLYLEPDGTFPHHAPNPEDKVAIDTLKKQVLACHADLGIIFDTDVDRAGAVDVKGEEINRNRLIALISAQLLAKRPGTIVTDSVTSDGLTKFIEERGGRHHRYMRGYRNVIDECKRLNDAGEYSPLAVETSGHCAFKDNYFLDDGAYLVTEILIILAGQLKKGKRLADLISGLEEPAEATEIRLPIDCDEFREYGKIVLKNFESAVKGCGGADIAPDNYEGVRVNFDKEHGDGWALVRMSLHEAIIPINIESGSLGGCKKMAKTLLSLLEENKKLDFTPLLNYIKS